MSNKTWLPERTIEAVAKRLGISARLLYDAVNKGDVATINLGYERRITEGEEERLQALLAQLQPKRAAE